jgi:hypothetical protein
MTRPTSPGISRGSQVFRLESSRQSEAFSSPREMWYLYKTPEKILNAQFQVMSLGKNEYALFPSEDKFNCGALAHGEG